MDEKKYSSSIESLEGDFEPDAVIAESSNSFFEKDFYTEVEKIDTDLLPRKPFYHAFKRLFDVTSCSLALVVLSPVMLVVAFAIKVDSPGPVIYSQERLGKGGKPFKLYKFRSMSVSAENDGAHWTSEGDSRVTKVGNLIRKTRIDEIPQFWNVVKGDMSLVGPRPERAVFYDLFEKHIKGFSQRLLVTPGISGLAQVSGGYDLAPQEKILYDLEYIKTQNAALDTKIILNTLGVMVSHEGAR